MRKFLFTVPVAALAVLSFASEAVGQTTATATATYEVTAINEVGVSANPGTLLIDTKAKMDSGVTDATTTWSVTTNETGKKITGAIDLATQTGVTLETNLTAPTGATSAGSKALGTLAVDLVTGISNVNVSGLAVVYTLKATPNAGVVASSTRTVTYTITAGV